MKKLSSNLESKQPFLSVLRQGRGWIFIALFLFTTSFKMAWASGVNLSIVGSGTVTIMDIGTTLVCTSNCVLSGVPANQSVTLVEVPAPGYVFVGWSGICTGTANTCVFTTGGGTQLETATFVLATPTNTPTVTYTPTIT